MATNTVASNGYNAHDHLVKISTKQGLKDYLPAAWRLYELNLKYGNANFSSEIIHLDPERDFVIVKVKLYTGPDYEMAEKKAEAMKQGPLSQLDKVETAAKARAARDFGVSTEFALDIDDDATAPEDEPPSDNGMLASDGLDDAPVSQAQEKDITELCRQLGGKKVTRPANFRLAQLLIRQLRSEVRKSPVVH